MVKPLVMIICTNIIIVIINNLTIPLMGRKYIHLGEKFWLGDFSS